MIDKEDTFQTYTKKCSLGNGRGGYFDWKKAVKSGEYFPGEEILLVFR